MIGGVKMAERKRKVRPTAILTLPIHPDLKDRIGEAADKAQMPMNEFVANVMAEHLGCPELAQIPRKTFGRPRIKNVPVSARANSLPRS